MDVYYHRIEGFHGLDSIKGIERYGKRAAALCNTEDILLLDYYSEIKIPIEEIELLNTAGLGPNPENIYAVKFSSTQTWQENLANNREVIHTLEKLPLKRFMPFTAKSPIIHDLVKHLDIDYVFSSQSLAFWGEDKSTLITLGEKHGHVPKGFTCKNKDEFLEGWEKLSLQKNFTGEAVIKPFQGASGLLSTIVKTKEQVDNFVTNHELPGGGVIQEWFEFKSSPSINYWIHQQNIEELFISDQIFEDSPPLYGKEGTCIHRGNVFPSNCGDDILRKIRDYAQPIVQDFADRGYLGPIGFDAIVANDNEVWIVEANPRVTGPHYGYFAAKKKNAHAFRLSNEVIKKGTTPQELHNHLQNLFLTKNSSEGYFVYNFSNGKFTGVVLGKSRQNVDEIYDKIQKKLAEIRS
ncbi:ATP-grasp domain-containing protein [Candidatus Uabimicrobium sp. HlEnr_7]|uniref:ATP-grasp domain-containing protein n=1 Tax=Candidatus Uabimicrobium helgolandensis TaxID=3095367 RepID=UPI003556F7C1